MNSNSIQIRVVHLLNEYLLKIAQEYQLDYSELVSLCEEKVTCAKIFVAGKNKGNRCPKIPVANQLFCSAHAPKTGPGSATAKAADKINELKSTAVPQTPTVLKRTKKGLLHEDTEIIFNESFEVIGRLENGKIKCLTFTDADYCEKMGWQYDIENVEKDA